MDGPFVYLLYFLCQKQLVKKSFENTRFIISKFVIGSGEQDKSSKLTIVMIAI